jgi:hypothetical protein
MRSIACTGQAPITPEIAVQCALRWLKGGAYQDIHDNAGISKDHFFAKTWQVFEATNWFIALDFPLPQTGNQNWRRTNPACNDCKNHS